VQHHKIQARQAEFFAALGHMTHLVGNQPANGVELVCVFVNYIGIELHVKGF
jgi:hypothetical protein